MLNIGFITQEPLEQPGRFFGQSSRIMPIVYRAMKEDTRVQMHNLSMNDNLAAGKLMTRFMKAYASSPEKKPLGPNMMARAFAEFPVIQRFLEGPVMNLPKLDALILDIRSIGAPYDFWEWCLTYYYLRIQPVAKVYIFDCDDLLPTRLSCVKEIKQELMQKMVVLKGTAPANFAFETLQHRWFIPEALQSFNSRPTNDLLHDISYAGYDYGRRALFDKYLTNINLNVNIMGKYPEDYIAKHTALKFKGVTDWHEMLHNYNASVGVLQLIRKRYIPIKMVPTRLWETAGSRTLSFLPTEYPDKEKWGLPELFVSCKADLEEKVKYYREHDAERTMLIEKNHAIFKNDKPADICNIILNHFISL